MSDRQPAFEAPTPASPTSEETPESGGRGSFLGFVAHEMRNPLSTALWSAELLVRLAPEERSGARGEKLTGMCLRALQRLRLLVEDHFLAERLEVKGIPFRLEPVPLREVLETGATRAGLVGMELHADDDVLAWADRGMLERAAEGLLAAAGRGKVPVRVDMGIASPGTALIRVHGAPAPPDALRPPQKGTASDPSGRSLALHMVGHVARALGGSLSLAQDDYLLALPVPAAGAASAPDGT